MFIIFILQYELRLVASDNLNENYTKVVIHVKDVNDNPPVFDRPTYETQITEEDDRNLPKEILKVTETAPIHPVCDYNPFLEKGFCMCIIFSFFFFCFIL